jgi:polar amino acid transport system permease protein
MNGVLIVWEQRQLFVNGLLNTISLVTVAAAVAILFGALFAVPLVNGGKVARRAGRGVVDFFRSVPFLLLAYIVYYGLPTVGLRLPAWWAGLLTLILYNSAYMAEIFRSAWLNLPHEQTETGRAFGFAGMGLYRWIIFPQVALASAPVVGNQLIIMIKDTAFLMIITVPEITFAANFVNANYFVPFAPFALAVLLYWGLCVLVEIGVHRVGAAASARRDA